MSLYIPTECQEFIRVCSSTETNWGMWLWGFVLGVIFITLAFIYK